MIEVFGKNCFGKEKFKMSLEELSTCQGARRVILSREDSESKVVDLKNNFVFLRKVQEVW